MTFIKSSSDQQVAMNEEVTFIVRTDLKGRIIDVNSAFIEVSGYSRDELIGSNSNVIRHPDVPAFLFERLWSALKQGYPWQGIIKNRSKDGRWFWTNAKILPVSDEFEVKGFVSLSQACSAEQVQEAEILFEQLHVNPLHTPSISWWGALKSKLQYSFKFASAAAQIFTVLTAAWLFFELSDTGNPFEMVVAGILALLSISAISYQGVLMAKVISRAQQILKNNEQQPSLAINELEKKSVIADFFRQIIITQGCLQADLVSSQQKTDELVTVNKALEEIENAFMLLDEKLNITFVNLAAKKLLQGIEADIQTQSSEFNANNILGSSLDSFFTFKETDRQFWKHLKKPLRGQVQFGETHLSYLAKPVRASKQGTNFILIEWMDRTKIQAEEQTIENVVNSYNDGDFTQRITDVHHLSQCFWVTQLINQLGEMLEQTTTNLINRFKVLSEGDTNKVIEQDQQGTIATLDLTIQQHFQQLHDLVHGLSTLQDQMQGGSETAQSYHQKLFESNERQSLSLQNFQDKTQFLISSLTNSSDDKQLSNLSSKTSNSVFKEANLSWRALETCLTQFDQFQDEFIDAISVMDEITFKINLSVMAVIGETEVSTNAAKDMRSLTQQSALIVRQTKAKLEEYKQTRQQTTYQIQNIKDQLKNIHQLDCHITENIKQTNSINADHIERVEAIKQASQQISDNLIQHEELMQEVVSSSLILQQQGPFVKGLLMRIKTMLPEDNIDLPVASKKIFAETASKNIHQSNHNENREVKSGWGNLAEKDSSEWEEF